MICPMYGMDCKCDASKPLQCHAHEIASPPRPTLAEIERLVDAVEREAHLDGNDGRHEPSTESKAARAALMAAIRQLSNSTQGGE